MIKQILQESTSKLYEFINAGLASDFQNLLQLVHENSYSQSNIGIPYFLDRHYQYISEFTDFILSRLDRRKQFDPTSYSFTPRGKRLVNTSFFPRINPVSNQKMIFPYSKLPPSRLKLRNRTVSIKPELDDLSIILTTLLSPDIKYYFIFSFWDTDGMRSLLPLLLNNDASIGLYMGDHRFVNAIPNKSMLTNTHKKMRSYLDHYISSYDNNIKSILSLLLTISRINCNHLCNNSVKLLNILTDGVTDIIDSTPSCQACNFTPSKYFDIILIKNSINRQWEKAVMSELFFSKLIVNAYPNAEVYPRLNINGLRHECDVFVRKNDEIFLFELKRSDTFDKLCTKGVTQLEDNKSDLTSWGETCQTYLVTNIDRPTVPTGSTIDDHLGPNELFSLKSII